jgi:hypothetical protein
MKRRPAVGVPDLLDRVSRTAGDGHSRSAGPLPQRSERTMRRLALPAGSPPAARATEPETRASPASERRRRRWLPEDGPERPAPKAALLCWRRVRPPGEQGCLWGVTER